MLNITDVETFTDPIQAIADGDELKNATLAPGIQGLANRTRLLARRIWAGEAASRKYLELFAGRDVQNHWTTASPPSGTGSGLVLQQAGTDPTKGMWWTAVLPPKCTIKAVVAEVHGGSGHAGLPATMPALVLQAWDWSGATAQYAQTDPSASLGAYEIPHTIAKTGLSIGVTGTAGGLYQVRIFGEGGANALANKFHIASVYLELDP